MRKPKRGSRITKISEEMQLDGSVDLVKRYVAKKLETSNVIIIDVYNCVYCKYAEDCLYKTEDSFAAVVQIDKQEELTMCCLHDKTIEWEESTELEEISIVKEKKNTLTYRGNKYSLDKVVVNADEYEDIIIN